MDRLWAPWRAQYIREGSSLPEVEAGPEPAPACFFCQGLASPVSKDRSNLLAARCSKSVVVLNRFPYNNGHVLVAPRVHLGTLGELSGGDLIEPLETVKRVIGVLDHILRPHAYNVGLNQGKAAGAGLPGHLHWHIVPRWDGDTNFMPILGQAKVIVESLDEFYDRLVTGLREAGVGGSVDEAIVTLGGMDAGSRT